MYVHMHILSVLKYTKAEPAPEEKGANGCSESLKWGSLDTVPRSCRNFYKSEAQK